MKKTTIIRAGIHANLDAMHDFLTHVLADTAEARGYIAKGEQNMAIGTIVSVEELLESVLVLYRAIRALHHSRL
jgi:hypothetical protein